MDPLSAPTLDEARSLVQAARKPLLFTGAGVSAESGVPTFRDRDGLWARFDPAQLATPDGFHRDPTQVWEWYRLRRRAVRRCVPNAAHRAVARFLFARPDACLVTQNVDGLHQRALQEEGEKGDGKWGDADPAARVFPLHGELMGDRCPGCGSREPASPERDSLPTLPSCPGCGELLRPDVVWFGEPLPETILDAAMEKAERADLCVVVGTSALVHPAAGIPLMTLRAGGKVIEVNTEVTVLTTQCHIHLRGPASLLVPPLLSCGDADAHLGG